LFAQQERQYCQSQIEWIESKYQPSQIVVKVWNGRYSEYQLSEVKEAPLPPGYVWIRALITKAPVLDLAVDSIPLDPVTANRQPKSASAQDSDDDSDDGQRLQVQSEDFSEIVECMRLEFNEPESFQFREAFEAGREQAHVNTAFDEGYKYGAAEAEANWELEHQLAGPYSSHSEVDSMLSEREAEWSAEEETRSNGSNERGAEDNEEEEYWRDAQWDENGEPIYERG